MKKVWVLPQLYDDPLDLEPEEEEMEETLRPVPLPTGLDDIDDAKRYLQLRFDETLCFCVSCETYFEQLSDDVHCNDCGTLLQPPGTPPTKRKRRYYK